MAKGQGNGEGWGEGQGKAMDSRHEGGSGEGKHKRTGHARWNSGLFSSCDWSPKCKYLFYQKHHILFGS